MSDAGSSGKPALDNHRRVLLVEDDPVIAQMYGMKLEMDGYLVEVAADGETGLSMAPESVSDLIVLDICLPGMDGLALPDAMRVDERTREVPILILTDYDDPATERRSLAHGARKSLLKSKTTPGDLTGWAERSIGLGGARSSH